MHMFRLFMVNRTPEFAIVTSNTLTHQKVKRIRSLANGSDRRFHVRYAKWVAYVKTIASKAAHAMVRRSLKRLCRQQYKVLYLQDP